MTLDLCSTDRRIDTSAIRGASIKPEFRSAGYALTYHCRSRTSLGHAALHDNPVSSHSNRPSQFPIPPLDDQSRGYDFQNPRDRFQLERWIPGSAPRIKPYGGARRVEGRFRDGGLTIRLTELKQIDERRYKDEVFGDWIAGAVNIN